MVGVGGVDSAVEVGGRKRVKCGNCMSDGLQLGKSLYCPVVCLGVVVLNGNDDEIGGEMLCDNCPKATFGSKRAVAFCMPRPVSNVMPFSPRQAKQISLAVLGITGQFG
jgi:hypothetical protein